MTAVGLRPPVAVGVLDELCRGWDFGITIIGGVSVRDEGGVVPADLRGVQCPANAEVGLCAGDDKPVDAKLFEFCGERSSVKGIPVVFVDDRFVRCHRQLGHDLPSGGVGRELIVGVLHPDDGHVFGTRLRYKRGDCPHDLIAAVCVDDHIVLHVDDKESGA